MKSKDPVVILEKRNIYWIIKFNRPERKNAFIPEMYALITQYLKQADVEDVKFVILTGVGDYFTSGADLATRTEKNADEFDRGKLATFRLFVEALILFRKPIIAAVNGPAIGIGTTMLGLCDLVLASDTSYFLTPFTRIGIVPEACSSSTFPEIMGTIKASNMLLFNQRMNADEAKVAGLVSEVFSDQTFWAQVTKKVESILELPEKSLLYGKALMRINDKVKLLEVNRQECERMIERHTSADPLTQAIKFRRERMKIKQARKSAL